MIRRTLSVSLTLLLAGCAQPALQPEVPAALPAGADQLQALSMDPASPLSVLGVAPPVSGMNYLGDRYMVRPAAHEVLHISAQGDVTAWGGLGSEAGRFNRPSSLAISVQHVLVADTGNHRVKVFDFKGKPVATWGAFGTRPGQFVNPRAVEVAIDGRVVVTDDYRVQYIEPDGTFLVDIPIALATGAPGAAAEDAQWRDTALSAIQDLRATLEKDMAGLDAAAAADYRAKLTAFLAEAAAPQLQGGVPFASAVVRAAVLQRLGAVIPDWNLLQVVSQPLVSPIGGTSQSATGIRAPGTSPMDLSAIDLETMMMMVQSDRANLLEAQLKNQIAEVQKRNELIKALNEVLGELNKIAATVPGGAKAADKVFTDKNLATFTDAKLQEIIDKARAIGIWGDVTLSTFKAFDKARLDAEIQRLKGQIDSQSNSQQMDMLRMQSLTNKRNEAFETMTQFIKKMQESRSAILNNMR